MTKEELQCLIDKIDQSAADMRRIAESYLDGEVLKDMVAAESWLMKAIAQEDEKESPVAMKLLATEVLKKEQVISDRDYMDIQKAWENAGEDERESLRPLLELATEDQRNTVVSGTFKEK